MKKKLSLALITILSTMMFSACSNPSSNTSSNASQSKSGKHTFGVICQALNSEYWKGFAQGARDGAAEVGVEVVINGPNAETMVTEQIAMIEDMMTNGVDALLVAANQPDSIKPTFDKAKQTGIPVMEVDVECGWTGRVCYVGAGNYNGGKAAGEWYNTHLEKGSKIAIIRGALGDPTHDLRVNGCTDTLDKSFQVVANQPANSEREKAVGVMENILTANPDIKAVFCTNDEMALGALKAIQAQKLDIKCIGFDGNLDALESVKENGLAATVSCVGYDIAKLAVITMEKHLNASEPKKSEEQVFVPPTAVDITNVDIFIKAAEDLKAKAK